MPVCKVNGPCPFCQKTIAQEVWYNIPEEVSADRRDKYYRFLWRGFFIFGLTGLLFFLLLSLMSNEYDMMRLEKGAHPESPASVSADRASELDARLQSALDKINTLIKRTEVEASSPVDKKAEREGEHDEH